MINLSRKAAKFIKPQRIFAPLRVLGVFA